MDSNPYRSPAAPLPPSRRTLPRGFWLSVGSFPSSVCVLMVSHLLLTHEPRGVPIVVAAALASGLTAVLSVALYCLDPLRKPPPPHTPSRP